MPDPANKAPQRQRRANWVALRTLRQRPRVAGETADGETVYEVDEVRLLLRGESPHFTRVVQCSKCGRDVPGAPVLTPEDLDRAPSPVICKNCVRDAGITTSRRAPERRSRAQVPAPRPSSPPIAPARDRVNEFDPGGGAAVGAHDTLAEVRAEVAAAAAEKTLRELETRVEEGMSSLVDLVESQRARLDVLTAAVGDTQREVSRLGEFQQQLAGAHGELDGRLSEIVDAMAVPTAEDLAPLTKLRDDLASVLGRVGNRIGAVEARLDGLSRSLDGEGAGGVNDRLRARPSPGGASARSLLEGLEEQLAAADRRLASRSDGESAGWEQPDNDSPAQRARRPE